MNWLFRTRIWAASGFLGCMGMLGSFAWGADESPLAPLAAGSTGSPIAPDVALDRWGDVYGRLVTRAANSAGEPARTLARGEFVGLEHAVIYARKVTRVHSSYSPDDDSPLPAAVLEVGKNGLSPHIVPLQTGQALVLRNVNTRPHVFLIRPPLERETNLLIGPGQEQTVVFQVPHSAPLTVTCSLHEDKPAYVFVTTHPYVCVTNADGEFVLRDLPAGEWIELCLWHERARLRHGEVKTSPEWTAGRRMVVVPAGAVLDLGESNVETNSAGPIRK